MLLRLRKPELNVVNDTRFIRMKERQSSQHLSTVGCIIIRRASLKQPCQTVPVISNMEFNGGNR